MSDQIIALNAFVPAERILKISDKEFDLSEIPFEFTLMFYDLLPIFDRIQKTGEFMTLEEYNKLFPIVFNLLKFCDETTEEKWLRKKITLHTFTEIITTITSAIFYDAKKNNINEAEVASPE